MAQITHPNELYDENGKSTESLYDTLYNNEGKLFYMCETNLKIIPSIVFHPNNIVSFKHASAIYYLKSIEVVNDFENFDKPQVVVTIINSRDGKTEYKRALKNKPNPFTHTFKFVNYNVITDIKLKNQVYTNTNKNMNVLDIFDTNGHIIRVNNIYSCDLISSRKFMDDNIRRMFDGFKKPDMGYITNQINDISNNVLKGNTNPESQMILMHDGTDVSWITPPDGTTILKSKKSKTKKLILVKEDKLVLPNEQWKATSDNRVMSFDISTEGSNSVTFIDNFDNTGIVWNNSAHSFNLTPKSDEIVVLKKKRKTSPKTIIVDDGNSGIRIPLGNLTPPPSSDYITFRSSNVGTIPPKMDISTGIGDSGAISLISGGGTTPEIDMCGQSLGIGIATKIE